MNKLLRDSKGMRFMLFVAAFSLVLPYSSFAEQQGDLQQNKRAAEKSVSRNSGTGAPSSGQTEPIPQSETSTHFLAGSGPLSPAMPETSGLLSGTGGKSAGAIRQQIEELIRKRKEQESSGKLLPRNPVFPIEPITPANPRQSVTMPPADEGTRNANSDPTNSQDTTGATKPIVFDLSNDVDTQPHQPGLLVITPEVEQAVNLDTASPTAASVAFLADTKPETVPAPMTDLERLAAIKPVTPVRDPSTGPGLPTASPAMNEGTEAGAGSKVAPLDSSSQVQAMEIKAAEQLQVSAPAENVIVATPVTGVKTPLATAPGYQEGVDAIVIPNPSAEMKEKLETYLASLEAARNEIIKKGAAEREAWKTKIAEQQTQYRAALAADLRAFKDSLKLADANQADPRERNAQITPLNGSQSPSAVVRAPAANTNASANGVAEMKARLEAYLAAREAARKAIIENGAADREARKAKLLEMQKKYQEAMAAAKKQWEDWLKGFNTMPNPRLNLVRGNGTKSARGEGYTEQ